MHVTFHTNLDVAQPFLRQVRSWSELGYPIPHKGESIRFTIHGNNTFRLEVVSVVYEPVAAGQTLYTVRVELHMPSVCTESIADWSERLRKRIQSA